MPEGFFDPLPRGLTADVPVTSGKFYNIEVYGDIYAEGGVISGDMTIIGNLSLSGDMDVAGDLYSDNWEPNGTVPLSLPDSGATTGWAMSGTDGEAQFQNIYAEGGTLGNLTVDGEVTVEDFLTMSTDGVLRTASSGQRVEFTNTAKNVISFYTGDTDEVKPGAIVESTSGTGGTRTLQFSIFGPKIEHTTPSQVDARAALVVRSGSPDGTSSQPGVVIAHNPAASGGGQPAKFFIQNQIDMETDGNLIFGRAADQIITKQSSGDLYIRNDNPSGGIYLSADNSIGTLRTRMFVDGAGAVRFSHHDAKETFGFTTISNQVVLFANNDSDDSIRFDTSANQWSIYVNDGAGSPVQELLLGRTGFTVPNVYNNTTGTTSANVEVLSGGAIRRVTSALKYKQHVSDASQLEDIRLKPVSYQRKDSGRWHYGFIADWLANQDERLGVYGDDEDIEDYDTRAVLAVMAAKINRLERQQARCNCAV